MSKFAQLPQCLLSAFLATISTARADEPKDAYGDPLPAAKARLGTARGAGWGRRDLTLLPPDYKSFVACESNRGVVICDLESGRTLKRFAQGKPGDIDLVAVSGDGKRLATWQYGTVKVWEISTGRRS